MTSPNLAVPHVAAAQNQKEVTINDATDALDLAMTASLELDCAAGGTVAVPLAVAQRNLRLVLTGAPGAAFDLVLPDIARALILRNDTGQVATVRTASGTDIDVEPDAQVLVHVAATGVTLVGAPPTAPEPEVA